MKGAAPSSEEVLARRVLGGRLRDGESFVRWAVARLEAGDDTPALRVLAGESEPFDAFVLDELCDRAFDGLGLAVPASRREAEQLWAVSIVRRMLSGELTPRETVTRIASTVDCVQSDADLSDFESSHRAYSDLDDDGVLRSAYLPHASRDTIDDVVRDACAAWLREHGGPA